MMHLTSVLTCIALVLSSSSAETKPTNMDRENPSKIIDFSKDPVNNQPAVTNDGVMGGLSQGKVQITEEGTLLFDGAISLENNGGFSSLRISDQPWDLSGWKGVELRVKGDGRLYGFRCSTDERYRWSPVAFTADFQTQAGEWTTVRVSFAAMRASWRGRKLERDFDTRKISSLGIILADKKSGGFRLEVESISVYR